MTRIFLDMDGVLADYEKLRAHYKVTGDELKRMNNAFLEMEPIEGAIAGVNSLIGMGYEVWVASKPATGLPHTYADKATWILQHLPQLKRRIILTHDKGLLGSSWDYLVDDRPHKANCEKFSGRLVVFGDCPGNGGSLQPWARNWDELLKYFRHWNQRGLTLAPRDKFDNAAGGY